VAQTAQTDYVGSVHEAPVSRKARCLAIMAGRMQRLSAMHPPQPENPVGSIPWPMTGHRMGDAKNLSKKSILPPARLPRSDQ
jgi:hypothetical protein